MKRIYIHSYRALIFAVFFACIFSGAEAQEDLMKELEEMEANEPEFTIATFKGTRVVNGHSIETRKFGELELIITHRFGRLNSGAVNFWGLDEAYIRIGLEYGITDRLGIGVGRNSFNDIFDGYFKYKLVRQGEGLSPVTVTAFASTGVQTYPTKHEDSTLRFFDRATYTYQLLVARKISEKLSLQLSPGLVHSNRVDQTFMKNDQYFLGIAGRYKLTRSLALNAEYYYRHDPHPQTPYYNSIGIGLDIETGGHVFQLIFSNTQGMIERTFINESEGDFFKGDINFGFNITRTFQLRRRPDL
jgi:hypothetical protein